MTDKLRAAAQAALYALERSSAVQLRTAISLRAALEEPKTEFICKCGLRVVPHQCKTDKEF
jgi:hypothetical protein